MTRVILCAVTLYAFSVGASLAAGRGHAALAGLLGFCGVACTVTAFVSKRGTVA